MRITTQYYMQPSVANYTPKPKAVLQCRSRLTPGFLLGAGADLFSFTIVKLRLSIESRS